MIFASLNIEKNSSFKIDLNMFVLPHLNVFLILNYSNKKEKLKKKTEINSNFILVLNPFDFQQQRLSML